MHVKIEHKNMIVCQVHLDDHDLVIDGRGPCFNIAKYESKLPFRYPLHFDVLVEPCEEGCLNL